MKNIIVIITALICVFLISCDSNTGQKGVATSPPKIDLQKPSAEPYSFKDFKLGMTLEEFNKLTPSETYKFDDKRFQVYRMIDTTIGGIKCHAFFMFNDYGKGLQLYTINITIQKDDFPSVKDALIHKYGSPVNTSKITKSNAMGAKFDGEQLIWINETSLISAESIGAKIDEAYIMFVHSKLGQSKQDLEDAAKARKDI